MDEQPQPIMRGVFIQRDEGSNIVGRTETRVEQTPPPSSSLSSFRNMDTTQPLLLSSLRLVDSPMPSSSLVPRAAADNVEEPDEVEFTIQYATLEPTPRKDAQAELANSALFAYPPDWKDTRFKVWETRMAWYTRYAGLHAAYTKAGLQTSLVTLERRAKETTADGIIVRFPRSAFLGQQYASPHPANDKHASSLPVVMIEKATIEDVESWEVDETRHARDSPKEAKMILDTKIVPIKDALAPSEDKYSEDWQVWYQVVDLAEKDERTVLQLYDIGENAIDRPYLETTWIFKTGIALLKEE